MIRSFVSAQCFRNLTSPQCYRQISIRFLSSGTEDTKCGDEVKPSFEKKDVSKAMKAYLERAREHDEFMSRQRTEFQIGKRHLANMMGEDPETFTQKDIDDAIEYLFPSGVYEKRARPVMRPPEVVYPQRKAAEFDETGRPHHFLFYTARPNFYKLLYDIVEHINELNKFEDVMMRKNSQPDSKLALELSGFQWMEKSALETKLVELISDKEYENFISAMERLSNHPYSYRSKDFIYSYQRPIMSQTKTFDIPKLQYDANGRAHVTTYECLRKRARGNVTLRSGSGKISINDKDITYFAEVQCREQVGAFVLFS